MTKTIDILIKKCNQCRKELPFSEYLTRKNSCGTLYRMGTCAKCQAKRSRIYGSKHKEEKKKSRRKWYLKNRLHVNLYMKNKRRTSSFHNLNSKMGIMTRLMLLSAKNGCSWKKLLGYTEKDLYNHLESLFTEGMTWELFREGQIHIDHIVPKSFFIFEKPEDQEFQYCWSLDNLQPLWAEENFKKSDYILNPNACSLSVHSST